MNCLNCTNDNTADYPVCTDCATTCHFTNRQDCKCLDCENKRAIAALPAGARERFAGAVLIATSDDAPGTVRVPFKLEMLKPECRLEIARGLSEMMNSLAKAA